MDTVSLNLSIPWVPSSNGEVLHPFDRLTEVIESKCTPIPSADKPWLRKAHEEVLSKFPNAAEALWETVLALWRLKITAPDEDSDPDDVLWESHVSAWLVSVSGRIGILSLILAPIVPPSRNLLVPGCRAVRRDCNFCRGGAGDPKSSTQIGSFLGKA